MPLGYVIVGDGERLAAGVGIKGVVVSEEAKRAGIG
jgi:hypothetical protein